MVSWADVVSQADIVHFAGGSCFLASSCLAARLLIALVDKFLFQQTHQLVKVFFTDTQ
jgi:hypothetical protein